ncbi:hypothetical protein CK203_093421 [Vitis vinifera]|uniref:Uncharacterized protein n=1 Tax=Vitis vinifera TaxID=29760 RepID=A0A438CJA8_VITVI|nr:hypothetical protein CK203_093421 [Vitis vinifera]
MASSASGRKVPPRGRGGIRTLSDLNRTAGDGSDSDSDGQEYYTGGEKRLLSFKVLGVFGSQENGFLTSKVRQLKQFLSLSEIFQLPSTAASRRILVGLELLHLLCLVLAWAPDSVLPGRWGNNADHGHEVTPSLNEANRVVQSALLGMCNVHHLDETPQWDWPGLG